MAGVSPAFTSTPAESTTCPDYKTPSYRRFRSHDTSGHRVILVLILHRLIRRILVDFGSEEDQSDEDEEITTQTTDEFIAAVARVGFTLQDLIQAENEIESAEKVSFSSPLSSDFRCPLSGKIINAITRERSLKCDGKPWKGSLPKPRISRPKTLGDAVIKKLVHQITWWTTNTKIV
jgi:hypothetical protein